MDTEQREYAIAQQYYRAEKTVPELAEMYELSRNRVRQIYSKFARQAYYYLARKESDPILTNRRGIEYELMREHFVEVSCVSKSAHANSLSASSAGTRRNKANNSHKGESQWT